MTVVHASDGTECSLKTLSRAEQRRRLVTNTARKLFVERGFHATGMAQIAKESGVAVGQIYRDFACKEDIVAALVETDCCRLMMYGALEDAIAKGDRGQVRAWLAEFIEPGEPDDARLFAEIFAESARNERISAIFLTVHEDLRARLLSALELLLPGIEQAERRAVLTDVIVTFSVGVFQHQLMRPALDVPRLTATLNAILAGELDLPG